MVANSPDQVRVDERDDMQHIQTQRLLALRVIAPPRSRLGQLIKERFAQLYEELGEAIDPGKRGIPGEIGSAQLADRTVANEDIKVDGAGVISGPQNGAVATGLELANTNVAQNAGLQDRMPAQSQDSAVSKETTAGDRAAAVKGSAELQRSRFRQSKVTDVAQATQINWVWMLSQMLKTDLKRLGLEPDEFDDIRVFLIKNEARKFDKLELLSRLPDSLSPEAVTKIFEDIRTMAAGYVAFVLVERVKSDLEKGEELKQMPEVPRSICSALYGIPLIDFDPEEALKKVG